MYESMVSLVDYSQVKLPSSFISIFSSSRTVSESTTVIYYLISWIATLLLIRVIPFSSNLLSIATCPTHPYSAVRSRVHCPVLNLSPELCFFTIFSQQISSRHSRTVLHNGKGKISSVFAAMVCFRQCQPFVNLVAQCSCRIQYCAL